MCYWYRPQKIIVGILYMQRHSRLLWLIRATPSYVQGHRTLGIGPRTLHLARHLSHIKAFHGISSLQISPWFCGDRNDLEQEGAGPEPQSRVPYYVWLCRQ